MQHLGWGLPELGLYLGEAEARAVLEGRPLTGVSLDAWRLLVDVATRPGHRNGRGLPEMGEAVLSVARRRGRCGAISYLYLVKTG